MGDPTAQDSREEELSAGANVKPFEGWRLTGTLASLALGLMLAVIETSITATALVTISEFFGTSLKATWVVLAYLLSYMGFAVIFARLSDGIGRREATIIAWVFFGAFSLAGGLSTTLNQLIGFRVLQGIGGSGLYSMIMVIGTQITPVKYWGAFSAMIGVIIATGSILGPILGGVITTTSSWRWIYLFNAPCSVVGIITLLLFWPRQKSTEKPPKVSLRSLQSVDFLGALLLLAASALLVFAIQEAGGDSYPWSSGTIIGTLVVSSVCWLAFFGWTSWLSLGKRTHRMRAIFPLTIAMTRPTGPAIIAIFCTGFPYFIAIINLPQRFQIANGNTPVLAGAHLLPLLCSMALGSGLGGAVSSKKNLTSHTLIVAACLILLGCGLMSTIKKTRSIDPAVYGYQFILGLGTGLTFSSVTVMTNMSNSPNDAAAAQGAISQARILGGSIGLAVATIILNNKLSKQLTGVLNPTQLSNLKQSLSTIRDLPLGEQRAVAQVYSDGFNQQMRICTYLSVVCVVASLATYSRNPASIAAARAKQDAFNKESNNNNNDLNELQRSGE